MAGHAGDVFQPLALAVLTVSDTRGLAEDTSGAALAERLQGAGHVLAGRVIAPDDRYRIRAEVSAWIADSRVDGVLISGGTGLTARDVTPEAVRPLLDREIPGFGELFRQRSFEEIGNATLQSRAVAGVANATLIFALPGSTGGCCTAWDRVLADQLDARTRPCNFATLLPRMRASEPLA
ncbi:molybdenum cofactor biosynthesis protein B [Halorhodospira halophila]|uniref:Molybdenum cofactor biosynthesis protein B n=1 Tax=Halorhodospira halophila (strain DSM 244 / SL1) TaxID=349124 RepID=A1WW52_HALHL|nr:molybdenum cofactor biosynthesis protein B [Halorhodospira halophila]ABM61914.1 molybdenum cofactor biosynthesis protein B [Halorhodospira halophila SL1]MBK1729754.1 molybdenum cofactor biosynthesis protein B [Halorhodospira halophila]